MKRASLASKGGIAARGKLSVVKSTITQKAPRSTSSASGQSPKARGLSAAQFRDLESRLHSLKKELLHSLESKTIHVLASQASESLIKGDDAEVAEKQRASNATLQELDILKNRLTLIQRALMKLNEGVYGLCEETEEPIGFERLLVVPWARFSVRIQEMRERKLRDFSISRLRSEA